MAELPANADLMARSHRPYNAPKGVSSIAFPSYLQNWATHIQREQDKQRKLFEMSVTIHRRARALTISDQCGHYGVRQNTQGRWLDYDPDLDGDIYPINIVGPAINTNQNACLQSNSVTEVQAANLNARNKQLATNWQRVADYFERTSWDEDERGLIFDGIQKDGTWLVQSYKEKKGKTTIAEIRERNAGLAVYQCQGCNTQGMYETEGIEEGMSDQPCPQCQEPAPHVVSSLTNFDLEESEVPTYKICHKLIPFYNFTIDAYNAKVKGIQGAKWLQIQTLEDRMQIETDYPGKVFAGPMRWSYPLRCDFALANGSWDYLNYTYTRSQFQDFDRFEKRQIYLHEEAYANYRFPDHFEFVNCRGELVFEAETGQTIGEAWEKMYGFNPGGFKFIWMDERLIDIVSPDDEKLDFRKCFGDVHFRRDSGSYLSSPHYSLVTIQDGITLLNTMNVNITARNAVIPVYYDSKVWADADFSKEYIGSKNAHLLPDRNMEGSITTLPVPTPSPYLQKTIDFYWNIKDSVSNVTPALRGEAQHGETLGAVRQQLEQSYGGLTSTLKSFARLKNTVFVQKAEIVKECWTVEDFQRVASMFGEVWTDEVVAQMCEVDFETDLIISYKEGSEMPQSNMDREMKFAAGIQSLLPFIEAGVPIPPDKFGKILEKIDEFAGFDFDLTGLELSDLLAQKRYLELNEICAQFGEKITMDEVDQMKTAIQAVDQQGTPITAMDLITEQIFHKAQIRFSEYEDLAGQMLFFVEQCQVEQAKEKPNYLFLEMLETITGLINQKQMEKQEEEMMNSPEGRAMAAEQAAAEAAAQADAENADREDANKEKDRQAANDQANADRAADLMKHAATEEGEMQKAALQGHVQKEVAKLKPKSKPAKAK